MLGGCLAKTALDVATAPVKVAGKAVDMATTSQSEADEKRGRALRMQEARLGQLEKRYWQLDSACNRGDAESCAERERVSDALYAMRATLPSERD